LLLTRVDVAALLLLVVGIVVGEVNFGAAANPTLYISHNTLHYIIR